MGEVFSWPEGTLYLWTGTLTASAVVTYAENVQASLARGYDNFQTLDSAYHDRLTGQRADITVGALYAVDIKPLLVMFESETAIHAHMRWANGVGQSGGVYLYSGRMDAFSIDGRKNAVTQCVLAFHANRWSGY